MKTYMAPIGFDSRRVVRPVLSEGLEADDVVVLLRPKDDSERGEDAIKEVTNILTQIIPDLELSTEELPYTDFTETVLLCADQIQTAKGEVIVILGGGARDILLPLTVATFTNFGVVDTVLQYGDINNNVQRIPRLNLQGDVSGPQARTLAGIAELNIPLSITKIASELNTSKSTITRHITSLESEGFVETAKQGRMKNVHLTDSGRIYLKSLRLTR